MIENTKLDDFKHIVESIVYIIACIVSLGVVYLIRIIITQGVLSAIERRDSWKKVYEEYEKQKG